jgi:hypothetical protein
VSRVESSESHRGLALKHVRDKLISSRSLLPPPRTQRWVQTVPVLVLVLVLVLVQCVSTNLADPVTQASPSRPSMPCSTPRSRLASSPPTQCAPRPRLPPWRRPPLRTMRSGRRITSRRGRTQCDAAVPWCDTITGLYTLPKYQDSMSTCRDITTVYINTDHCTSTHTVCSIYSDYSYSCHEFAPG